MFDIRIEFGPLELIALVFMMGWPGLLIGGAAGAWAWKRHRVAGLAIGALLGVCAWGGVSLAQL